MFMEQSLENYYRGIDSKIKKKLVKFAEISSNGDRKFNFWVSSRLKFLNSICSVAFVLGQIIIIIISIWNVAFVLGPNDYYKRASLACAAQRGLRTLRVRRFTQWELGDIRETIRRFLVLY